MQGTSYLRTHDRVPFILELWGFPCVDSVYIYYCNFTIPRTGSLDQMEYVVCASVCVFYIRRLCGSSSLIVVNLVVGFICTKKHEKLLVFHSFI